MAVISRVDAVIGIREGNILEQELLAQVETGGMLAIAVINLITFGL